MDGSTGVWIVQVVAEGKYTFFPNTRKYKCLVSLNCMPSNPFFLLTGS